MDLIHRCASGQGGAKNRSALDRPHPEVRPEGREPLADKAGESTLLSRSGGEKGLRGGGAGKPRCSSRGRPGFRGTLCVASRVPGPFRPPIPNVGLLLRRCRGKGLHLAMTGEPRGFSRVTAGFSSYDGEFRMPLVLAQASPIFHSSCEGKLGIALE